MKKFYISSLDRSGATCNYSKDFYGLVLKGMEYEFVDSDADTSTILSIIASKDQVHLEIGLGRNREWELLQIMLNANYRNVAITLHHPDWFRETLLKGKHSLLTPIAVFYYHTIGKFRIAKKYLKKIKWIYVLTPTGQAQLESTFKLRNVRYLPRIVNPFLTDQPGFGCNIFCKVTSLEKERIRYLLRLHKKLLDTLPNLQLFIAITKPVSDKKIANIRNRFDRNVQYVQQPGREKINAMLKECAFSVIVEKEAGTSGEQQLLWYFQKGKVVFADKNNDNSGLLSYGNNAFNLTGDMQKDITVFKALLSDPLAITTVRERVSRYLKSHSFHHIRQQLNH